MFAALMILALQAQAAAPAAPTADNTVSQVTVTAGAKTRTLPQWTQDVEPRGWPFLGVSDDRSVLMFAKTAPGAAAPLQRVLVRHEFHDAQTETGVAVATQPYRSERLVQDVDCARRTFRSVAVYRYPQKNLEGAAEGFSFADQAWRTPEPGSFDETIVTAACTFPKDVAVLPAPAAR